MDRALNRNDRGNIGLPFRPDDGGRRIKHGNVSGFMAIALFLIDRLNTRKRQGRIASGLDLLTQGGLVILEGTSNNDDIFARSIAGSSRR
jgi:hypothetical protein